MLAICSFLALIIGSTRGTEGPKSFTKERSRWSFSRISAFGKNEELIVKLNLFILEFANFESFRRETEMKNIFIIGAMLAVCACSKPTTPPKSETTPASTPSVTNNIAADGKTSLGTYKVTRSDGSVVTEDVKADGTYQDSANGKVVETGKWEQKSPNIFCTTSDKEGSKQSCNDEKLENGVWTSKNDDGKVATVERIGS